MGNLLGIGALIATSFYSYTPMPIPARVLLDNYGLRKLFVLTTSFLTICGYGCPMLLQPLISKSINGTTAKLQGALTSSPVLFIIVLFLTIYWQMDSVQGEKFSYT